MFLGHRRQLRMVCAAVVAAGAFTAIAPSSLADGVFYYDGLTEAENAEVAQWSLLYWQRVDQGGGSPGEGFVFTNPQMNSQLFNPVRCARPTLEKLEKISPGLCDRMYEQPTGLDASTTDQRAAIRDVMLTGELITGLGTQPGWEHIMLIEAAPPEAGWLAYTDGGQLITVDLPLSEVSKVAAESEVAQAASPESQQILATLIAAGGQWAGECDDIPQWRSLITGETSTAEKFRAKVDDYLAFQGNPDLNTQLIQANFGTFGELPVIAVSLSDCYILMDPTNGNLSGPFQVGSPLDARGLLSMHAGVFEAGASVVYYNEFGCTVGSIAAWYPALPVGPAGCPVTWIPAVTPPGTPPGWQTAWACRTIANAGGAVACTCVSSRYLSIIPAPACWPTTLPLVVREQLTCTAPGACPLGPPALPTGTVPCPWGLTPRYWY